MFSTSCFLLLAEQNQSLFQGKSVHSSAIFAAIMDIGAMSKIAANMAELWTDFPWKRNLPEWGNTDISKTHI